MTEDFTLRLPNYEGPLDVLLRLIEERHLEITRVSLAKVADQFIEYLSAAAGRDPNTLSNFLAVAARLIVLKSRALLPQLAVEAADEEDDADDLVAQLKAYQLYKRTARWLRTRQESGLRSYPAAPPPIARPKSRQLPLDNVTLEALARAMQRVADRWMPPPLADGVVSRLPFTVNDCIARIESAVLRQAPHHFQRGAGRRGLARRNHRHAAGSARTVQAVGRPRVPGCVFGEIIIEPIPPEERPIAAAE